MTVNTLPFQYPIRGNSLQYLDGHEHAAALESRDIELEDYLGRLLDQVAQLEARVTALEGP